MKDLAALVDEAKAFVNDKNDSINPENALQELRKMKPTMSED